MTNLNPATCLAPSVVCANIIVDDDDVVDYDVEVKPLLRDLRREGKLRTTALQKLYRMTDKESQKNR